VVGGEIQRYPATPITITPFGPPDAPVVLAPTPGDRQLTISWNEAPDGGSPIIEYVIAVNPMGTVVTASASSRSVTVSGLTNGTSYTATVGARNLAGTTNSLASPAAVPVGPPAKPVSPSVVGGDQFIFVSWALPDSGGAELTSITLVIQDNQNGEQSFSLAGASTSARVGAGGLGNPLNRELSYVARIQATNQSFTGELSEASNPVFPVADTASPSLTQFTPVALRPQGGSLEISGTSLAGVTSIGFANCGGSTITLSSFSTSPEQLGMVAPACTPGDVLVSATNSAGPSNPITVRYRSIPTITSLSSPTVSALGGRLTITGTGFVAGEMWVRVGQQLVTGSAVTVSSATSLNLAVPALSDPSQIGTADVTVSVFGLETHRVTTTGAITFVSENTGTPPPGDPGGDGGGTGGGTPPGSGSSGGGSPSTSAEPQIVSVPQPVSSTTPVVVEFTVPAGRLELRLSGLTAAAEVTVTVIEAPATAGVTLLATAFDISVVTTGRITQSELCVPIDPAEVAAASVDLQRLSLYHFNPGPVDITTRVTATQVCGVTSSFSPFALGVPASSRIAGANRYDTAARLVGLAFPGTADLVLVATGANFPDALAASAAAAKADAPLLLVNPTAIPAATRAQLSRLKPKRIVIVGGTAAVSAAVEQELSRLGIVERVAGANRFETAARLATRFFGSGTTAAYLVSGENFPDALAAGAASSYTARPVLLTGATKLPAATLAVLRDLGISTVTIVGGDRAVSASVFAQTDAVVPQVRRIAGQDRYETATRLADSLTTPGRNILLATGMNFPDALGAAAVAARLDATLILTAPTSASRAATLYLGRRTPSTITVLGGYNAIARSTESLFATAYLR
jgi:putative cell wall-binding protein